MTDKKEKKEKKDGLLKRWLKRRSIKKSKNEPAVSKDANEEKFNNNDAYSAFIQNWNSVSESSGKADEKSDQTEESMMANTGVFCIRYE